MNGDRRKFWSRVIIFPNRRKISFFDSNHCLCGPPLSPQIKCHSAFLLSNPIKCSRGWKEAGKTKWRRRVLPCFRRGWRGTWVGCASRHQSPRTSGRPTSSPDTTGQSVDGGKHGTLPGRHAQAQKPLTESCLWDHRSMVGMAGDWCCGSPIEGALLRGAAMAGRILADFP